MTAERIEADLCAQLVRYGGSESLLERVSPEHFASPQLAAVASTAIDMLRDGREVTSESLVAELLKRGRKGGAEALRFLDRHSLPREWDPMRATLELAEAARRRRMADVGRRLVRAGEAGDGDEWRAILQAALDEGGASESDEIRIKDGHGILAEALEMAQARVNAEPMGVGKALAGLARELQPRMLVTIGGQTGAGKSSLALHLAMAWWESRGAPMGVVSLEDPWGTWGDRWQSRYTGRSLLGDTREEVAHTITLATVEAKRMDARSIQVAEPNRADLGTVLRHMRALVRQGCSALVVDYVQEIRVHGVRDRREEVTRAASAVKSEGKRLEVPVILCSQLARTNGEPTQRNLKESGDLENISEGIVLLWRESDQPDAAVHGKVTKLKNSPPKDRSRFDLLRGDGVTESAGKLVLGTCTAGGGTGGLDSYGSRG